MMRKKWKTSNYITNNDAQVIYQHKDPVFSDQDLIDNPLKTELLPQIEVQKTKF